MIKRIFLFSFLIDGLFGWILAYILPKKVFTYSVPLLMAVAGFSFLYIFGYLVYDLILDPQSMLKIIVIGLISLFTLGLSFASFHLMNRAWKSRNE